MASDTLTQVDGGWDKPSSFFFRQFVLCSPDCSSLLNAEIIGIWHHTPLLTSWTYLAKCQVKIVYIQKIVYSQKCYIVKNIYYFWILHSDCLSLHYVKTCNIGHMKLDAICNMSHFAIWGKVRIGILGLWTTLIASPSPSLFLFCWCYYWRISMKSSKVRQSLWLE